MPNGEIFEKAIREDRIVITFDLDFGEIAALTEGRRTSVILFRLKNTRTPHAIERLSSVIDRFTDALKVAAGHAWGDSVALPFLRDVEMHVRLLLALPLLVVAELVVHQRMRPVVRQFLDRDLIPDASRPQFDAAVASAMRLRNSVLAECLLIALVYGVGVLVLFRTQVALDAPTWYRVPVHGTWRPTLAGWWLACVSVPVLQSLLLRWYFRVVVWARFLWHVSRIGLALLPTHPDRCGGLGFLAGVVPAFAPVHAAQGVLLAGTIASKIFFAGASLPEFKVELIGIVAVMVFAVLGPLLVFSRKLGAAKRAGLREYGTLAQRCRASSTASGCAAVRRPTSPWS